MFEVRPDQLDALLRCVEYQVESMKPLGLRIPSQAVSREGVACAIAYQQLVELRTTLAAARELREPPQDAKGS